MPSHLADIDGTPVHHLRFDGERPGALPLVLTNGWPSSFLELTASPAAWPRRRGTGATPPTRSPSSSPRCPGSPSHPSGPRSRSPHRRMRSGTVSCATNSDTSATRRTGATWAPASPTGPARRTPRPWWASI
ncbi:epoxide hydrolase N-terminal domain-containing protein [Streptomyces sp. NPDC039022]|uniref:epoxide hydrolase N-terminal domain-containing protein n=1 Tax=Streptomyces sp. NPDC039022 TaxID=3157091 RepID=UPI0033C0FF74